MMSCHVSLLLMIVIGPVLTLLDGLCVSVGMADSMTCLGFTVILGSVLQDVLDGIQQLLPAQG